VAAFPHDQVGQQNRVHGEDQAAKQPQKDDHALFEALQKPVNHAAEHGWRFPKEW
jgi:hypothetical protein